MSPHIVMEWQAITLFRHNRSGRLLATNEPGDLPAPLLFVGRTRQGVLWRFRHDLPTSLVRTLDRLLATEQIPTDLRQSLVCFTQVRDTLADYAPITSIATGPAWWCPEGIAPAWPVATVRLTDGTTTARTFPWLADELAGREPCFAVVEDGEGSGALLQFTSLVRRGGGGGSDVGSISWAGVCDGSGRGMGSGGARDGTPAAL